MLAVVKAPRKPSSRQPFLTPLWDDRHPDFRRIDLSLPADHHARWLKDVVSRLDLTAFRLRYHGYGSLAYPVELLLAFVLFMYSEAVLCPAKWAVRVRYDEQSKWLLRGLRPSRSLLYSFRDRVEPFLDAWHRQIICWAVTEGITSASRGSLDGTFVASLASRHQLMSCRRVDRRLLLLRLLVWFDDRNDKADLPAQLQKIPEMLLHGVGIYLDLLGQGIDLPALLDELLALAALVELLSPEESDCWQLRLPAWLPATRPGRDRVLKRYEQAQQRLAQKMQPYRQKKKLSKKDQQAVKRMKLSVSDPEAALGWDKMGTFRPLYNVQLVQATDAPLTLAFDVLARNNDDGLLKPMMEKAKEQLGHHLQETLVDGAFVSSGEAAWCEEKGIVLYAPCDKKEAAKGEKAEGEKAEGEAAKKEADKGEKAEGEAAKKEADKGEKGAGKEQKKYGKEEFSYDKEEEVYRCPQGKVLEEAYRTTEKRQSGLELEVIVYRADGQDCQGCAEQKRCTSNAKKGRVVKRYEGEDALERLRERMQKPESKEIYKQRCRTVELGYADLKEHRGMRVFRCFGKERARAQAGLVILACNGLNIMRALMRRQEADPPVAVGEKQPARSKQTAADTASPQR